MVPIEGRARMRVGPAVRAALCLLALALLSACGASYNSAAYEAQHRRGDYAPPGPPEDPWGPYIREASSKYRVPEQWVRAVMRQESGGREYLNGKPITSNAGAMGLMQVMPGTYATLADRYGLGGDPYDPHDNIMAGTAYIREMYEQFGSPGFLAAYNAGPGRLSSHLATGKPLPSETVQYVAAIAPRLGSDVAPSGEFAAYARVDRSNRAYDPPARVMVASAVRRNPNGDGRSLADEAAWQTGGQQPTVQVAVATPPVRSTAEEAAWQTGGQQASVQVAMATPPARSPAEEAAWQTSPGQYGGASMAASTPIPPAPPAPPPAPPPVLVASAEPPRSALAAASLPPPTPFGGAPRPMPAVAEAPPRNSFLVASARAGELPPAMRYAPVPSSRPAPAPALPMPPPPPGPGMLGTLPLSRHGAPEPAPRLQFASAVPGAAHVFGGSGSWTIQVGAYATPALAHSMAENAQHVAGDSLRGARATVAPVNTASGGTLYRARFTGLSAGSASAACGRLSAGHMSCAALPPDEKW
jgi:D-alanyl-D-alanine carboxypeptidase